MISAAAGHSYIDSRLSRARMTHALQQVPQPGMSAERCTSDSSYESPLQFRMCSVRQPGRTVSTSDDNAWPDSARYIFLPTAQDCVKQTFPRQGKDQTESRSQCLHIRSSMGQCSKTLNADEQHGCQTSPHCLFPHVNVAYRHATEFVCSVFLVAPASPLFFWAVLPY